MSSFFLCAPLELIQAIFTFIPYSERWSVLVRVSRCFCDATRKTRNESVTVTRQFLEHLCTKRARRLFGLDDYLHGASELVLPKNALYAQCLAIIHDSSITTPTIRRAVFTLESYVPNLDYTFCLWSTRRSSRIRELVIRPTIVLENHRFMPAALEDSALLLLNARYGDKHSSSQVRTFRLHGWLRPLAITQLPLHLPRLQQLECSVDWLPTTVLALAQLRLNSIWLKTKIDQPSIEAVSKDMLCKLLQGTPLSSTVRRFHLTVEAPRRNGNLFSPPILPWLQDHRSWFLDLCTQHLSKLQHLYISLRPKSITGELRDMFGYVEDWSRLLRALPSLQTLGLDVEGEQPNANVNVNDNDNDNVYCYATTKPEA